ncbi:hypothetical protein BA724_16780 [Domibacillus iocasae]|uniref:DUF5659 domain-containing protein n=1 Tax=Domibacillus iocasae TaxID=1714016 RepID=A0A1E7DSH3_9BACI|nr:hypothetical protein BA724_16780 [Domibacillus iocasae]
MSVNNIKNQLKTLCYYNNCEITHTFSKDGHPFLKVCCLKNTKTLQVTFVACQTIEYYEDVTKAASIIEKLINE